MKIILLFGGIILYIGNTRAQAPCGDEMIMNVKGSWMKHADANMKKDNNQAQIMNRIDAINKLYLAAYPEPKGIEAAWYRTMEGDPLIVNGPTPYQFSSLYKTWYCNQNLHKLMLGTETGTWSHVYVNRFGKFMSPQYDEVAFKIAGITAFLLPQKIGQWQGFSLYEPSGNTGKCKAILISRNNQLPYLPATRLQVLQSVKEVLETKKQMQIDADNNVHERTEAEQEAAKQNDLENVLKGARSNKIEERKANFIKNYKTDRQRKDENIQHTQKYFDNLINGVDNVWKSMNENDLKKPAFVDADYASSFKEFVSEEKGRMVVFINDAYFNTKLPKYVPQFMVLYWEWDKNAPAQNFKKVFEDNFPVDQLKALIDK